MPKKKDEVVIPENFKKLIEDYGFDDAAEMLKNAVATRKASEWFAILFKDTSEEPEGAFFAVDFRYGGFQPAWEIQNDYVGPFESIKEFQTEELTQSFF